MHHNPVEHPPYLNTPKLSPVLETILDHATWAPSGDNIQPWRITPLTSTSCSLTVVYGDDNIFDLDHASTHMALGTFIETACITAVTHGYEPLVECVVPGTDTPPMYTFTIFPLAESRHEPLFQYIEHRHTNRFPFRRTPITTEQKDQIGLFMPPGYRLHWISGSRRMRMAFLCFLAGCIRYAIPESFRIHQETIDWKNMVASPDRIPSRAIGMPRFMLPLVHFFMMHASRFQFFTRYFAGHITTALQLDAIPNFFCGGHVAILADAAPKRPHDFVMAGRAMQRLWLATTACGLASQPLYSPMIFSRYAEQGIPFTNHARAKSKAQKLSGLLKTFLGLKNDTQHSLVWLARIGQAGPISARSTRRRVAAVTTERHP